MDRFNSNEPLEETPLSIAKDIIYSDSSKEEQVSQITQELIKAHNRERELITSLYNILEWSKGKSFEGTPVLAYAKELLGVEF